MVLIGNKAISHFLPSPPHSPPFLPISPYFLLFPPISPHFSPFPPISPHFSWYWVHYGDVAGWITTHLVWVFLRPEKWVLGRFVCFGWGVRACEAGSLSCSYWKCGCSLCSTPDPWCCPGAFVLFEDVNKDR